MKIIGTSYNDVTHQSVLFYALLEMFGQVIFVILFLIVKL